MIEQGFRFGTDDTLMGVLSRPAHTNQEVPVALILNAGIVHRVGPFRLHVDLARALAERGYPSLRIDLSGIGDSEIRNELPEGSDRVELDVADAMASLNADLGTQTFVPIGLCSGAYKSHQVAFRNEHAVGGVFLDGIVYETWGHARRKLLGKMRYRRVRNAIKQRLVKEEPLWAAPSDFDTAEFFSTDQPAREVADEIKAMLQRQMQLLFLYTEGYEDISSARQFKEMFDIDPDGEQLQVDYNVNFEHTLRLTSHRRTVIERIAGWFESRFPIPERVLD
ncbi:MAG: alpha/beta fold hydrolase [Planctomycetota bacterium]